ncbi:hypothetical protein GQ43DRAFT_8077 [Delitschia confertaspora ATCC 74209]|uniref:Uncharacterized protein n=1 Tax=Delitschia confertaspora ATCC 74209 TaxID=1513339 RepID=A0A9P4JMJ4_9PLEO|nr:hypothetical protein GQ43DRAFT_8077 [Delitschia confertaspora ATCC 74209]
MRGYIFGFVGQFFQVRCDGGWNPWREALFKRPPLAALIPVSFSTRPFFITAQHGRYFVGNNQKKKELCDTAIPYWQASHRQDSGTVEMKFLALSRDRRESFDLLCSVPSDSMFFEERYTKVLYPKRARCICPGGEDAPSLGSSTKPGRSIEWGQVHLLLFSTSTSCAGFGSGVWRGYKRPVHGSPKAIRTVSTAGM